MWSKRDDKLREKSHLEKQKETAQGIRGVLVEVIVGYAEEGRES